MENTNNVRHLRATFCRRAHPHGSLFNFSWAYVYCGLYGMDYITAGRNVITLFKHKGWTVIISDDLASNVLLLITFGIGILTGLIGLMIGYADADLFAGLGFENGSGPGFLVGFLVGFLFASIYLGVVDSAITTVIVCYAEAPAEFQMVRSCFYECSAHAIDRAEDLTKFFFS